MLPLGFSRKCQHFVAGKFVFPIWIRCSIDGSFQRLHLIINLVYFGMFAFRLSVCRSPSVPLERIFYTYALRFTDNPLFDVKFLRSSVRGGYVKPPLSMSVYLARKNTAS